MFYIVHRLHDMPKTIAFRADEKLVKLLEIEADRRRVKVSWLIRIILLDALQPVPEKNQRKNKKKD